MFENHKYGIYLGVKIFSNLGLKKSQRSVLFGCSDFSQNSCGLMVRATVFHQNGPGLIPGETPFFVILVVKKCEKITTPK